MTSHRVRPWTEAELLSGAGRDAWQRLLARSRADPLFMSWDWIAAWWRHHAELLRATLQVLAVESERGELLGLAPLYSHRCAHRAVFRARRLELLGVAWRDPDAVFSEYLDVIAADEARETVCAALRVHLRASADWDELVLCNVREDSVAAQLATGLAPFADLRRVESMTGWSLALPTSFAEFAATLSSNTRRRVVHQREKLAAVHVEVTDPARRRESLARLDHWVARRWGTTPTLDARAHFHADLVENWLPDRVRVTELRTADTVVSTMINLRVGDTEYYLQSGFDAALASGVSPGYLHLGYAIEAACRDGLRRFDFLAGGGRHRDYKQDFAASPTTLVGLHVVRKPALRALFRLADRLRGR